MEQTRQVLDNKVDHSSIIIAILPPLHSTQQQFKHKKVNHEQ